MIRWEMFFRAVFEKGGWERILEGLRNTVLIAIFGLIIGIVIGTLIAIIKVIPRYKRITRFFQTVCNIYVSFFRGTPIVVQLLVGRYVLLPLIGVRMSSLMLCIVIFGLNSGAYVSEIMRSGIQSVDVGQLEAARALGMTYPVSMLKIVIPQAIKNILPTIGNEFIVLIKETSVTNFVGTLDLTLAFQEIGTGNYDYMIPYLMLAVVYIVLVLVITLAIRLIERRLKRSDRSR